MRFLPALILAACTNGTVDPDGSTAPVVAITSPQDGAAFTLGDGVELAATVTDADGGALQADVAWSAEGWSADGNSVTVFDLPEGELTLTAEVTVDDLTGSDSVTVTVSLPDPVDYSGILDMDIDVHTDAYGDFDGIECEHRSLEFTVAPEQTFSGTGACEAPYMGEIDFFLEGSVDGDVVTGEMWTADTIDDPLEFEGTRGEDDAITASYDKTWSNDGGSIRLYGSFTASPQ